MVLSLLAIGGITLASALSGFYALYRRMNTPKNNIQAESNNPNEENNLVPLLAQPTSNQRVDEQLADDSEVSAAHDVVQQQDSHGSINISSEFNLVLLLAQPTSNQRVDEQLADDSEASAAHDVVQQQDSHGSINISSDFSLVPLAHSTPVQREEYHGLISYFDAVYPIITADGRTGQPLTEVELEQMLYSDNKEVQIRKVIIEQVHPALERILQKRRPTSVGTHIQTVTCEGVRFLSSILAVLKPTHLDILDIDLSHDPVFTYINLLCSVENLSMRFLLDPKTCATFHLNMAHFLFNMRDSSSDSGTRMTLHVVYDSEGRGDEQLQLDRLIISIVEKFSLLDNAEDLKFPRDLLIYHPPLTVDAARILGRGPDIPTFQLNELQCDPINATKYPLPFARYSNWKAWKVSSDLVHNSSLRILVQMGYTHLKLHKHILDTSSG